MTTHDSSRRSFIRTAGVAMSAPLAAVVTQVPLGAAAPPDPLQARLAHLEDVQAIRALNQAYARHLNAGAHEALVSLFEDPRSVRHDRSLRAVTADSFGEHDVVEVTPDRTTATASVYCSAETETALDPDCPLVAMAREQGGGVVRHTGAGVLQITYVHVEAGWKLRTATFRAT